MLYTEYGELLRPEHPEAQFLNLSFFRQAVPEKSLQLEPQGRCMMHVGLFLNHVPYIRQ